MVSMFAASALLRAVRTPVGDPVWLGADVTVHNGGGGLGDLSADLVGQGLRIFGSVRQSLGDDAPGRAPAVRQEGDR